MNPMFRRLSSNRFLLEQALHPRNRIARGAEVAGMAAEQLIEVTRALAEKDPTVITEDDIAPLAGLFEQLSSLGASHIS